MPGEQGMNRREKNRTDRRTKYTRNLIKEVLMAFLKERRFETITVTEICRRAEINRGTFYLHYLDTYNVLEDLVDDFLSETTDTMQHVLCPQQSSCTHSLCSRIQSSEKYWPLLTDDTAAAQVLKRLMENGLQMQESEILTGAIMTPGINGLDRGSVHSDTKRAMSTAAHAVDYQT